MEALIVLALIAIIVLIINLKNGVYERLKVLEKQLHHLNSKLAEGQSKEIKPVQPAPVKPPAQSAAPMAQPMEKKPEAITPAEPPKVIVQPVARPQQVKPPAPAPRKPGFFERHPDLEKFIGENLISKIGIAILVLGIGFFVKYAIDNDWIGPVGRVSVGLLCGAILVTVAHYLRKLYPPFSSVLIGGGIAVFYFTISLAFYEYHLFGQTAAFIIMIVITCFAVALSLLYNRQEVAIIALVGGFVAPFLVSNGSGNYVALFLYLLILNTGLLVIALKKSWRLLNLLAFLFTALLFGSWLALLPSNEKTITYRNGFLFASAFYVLFFVINIIHNIKEKKKFIASDFGILLANTCLYFAAGLVLINMMGAETYRGIFCMSLGVINLAVSYALFRKSRVDTNILYLLIGLTLTFISLTAPIQLNGNYITLFWASEAVLLFWLFQRSRIGIMRIASVIVWCAMLISVLIDIFSIYIAGTAELPIIFNKGFLTILICSISSYLLFVLWSKETAPVKSYLSPLMPAKNIFRIVALLLLYCAGLLEIDYQFVRSYPGIEISSLYQILFTLLFILAIIYLRDRFPLLQTSRKVIAVLFAIGILVYLFQIDHSFQIQRLMLEQQEYQGHFIAHWLTAICVVILIWKMIRSYRTGITERHPWMMWIVCMIVLIFLTAEIHLLINTFFYSGKGSISSIQRVYVKAGWPIVWGLSSFGFMWIGMRRKLRMLRIISLTLFTITLIKLFVYDIVNIPAGGKIAAFFSLGVLLLIISFMYQRLKKIIIDEKVITK